MKESLRPSGRQYASTAAGAAAVLEHCLDAALDQDPRIDAVAFTGEDVVRALVCCLGRPGLTARPHVTLRVIVPDFTRPVPLPGRGGAGGGGAEDDAAARRALLRRVLGHAQDVAALRRALARSEQARLDGEFRALHLTPFPGFCLIGREQLVDGGGDPTRWHAGAGAAARERIRHRGLLFDTLWGLARPLPTRTA
ncbi:hypothetical protein [Streptomyces spectabilis]|uniref:Uncharacterized protein n=1 Tax=Streptomyces spectabilis TaxID=68270 RepID=A0A516R9H5_STRST|nr:hypothetical protein [Streptomyces spectabilis]QDQ12303.1 hypothetical protein FH965_18370 [Streptomyces spectabilis]